MMTPTMLHALARRADAITTDADLLTRYTRERDNRAFEELVRRHGPLVWAVCRQMLSHHADAEDAFQAVFLAFARSAPSIRDGRAVPAWLHGVAVRVATRARRSFARQRARERTASLPEADRPVSDAAWESLVAAVHEEVHRLPDAERTAFVLCDLEGVSQADAATRLGWPLGTVSGRLCKARQQLLDRITARGIAPAVVVGIGLATGTARAMPTKLFDAVKVFPGAPTAASHVATALARGLTEGVAMRVKLTAAIAVLIAALGLTGSALVLSKADAQSAPGAPSGRPGPSDPPDQGGFSVGGPGVSSGGPPGLPSMSGPGQGVGNTSGWSLSPATFDYKFVDIKSDRKEFEKVITQHGKDGWEFCGSERFNEGNKTEIALVFKKRKGGDSGGFPGNGFGSGAPGGMGGETTYQVFPLKRASATDVVAALNKAIGNKGQRLVAENSSNSVLVLSASATVLKEIAKLIVALDEKTAESVPGAGPVVPGVGSDPVAGAKTPPSAAKPAMLLTVFQLKNAKAEEMVVVLQKLFPNTETAADPRTNTVIARADEQGLEEMRALIAKLEASDPVKPK